MEQRLFIRCDTFYGVSLMLDLAIKKQLRQVRKEDGWIAIKKEERKIFKLINFKFFGKTV